MRVLVREGDTILDCKCPVDSCDNCKLRFKCYSSRTPLEDLTLSEKILLTRERPIIIGDIGWSFCVVTHGICGN